jgi:hypothetical protein
MHFIRGVQIVLEFAIYPMQEFQNPMKYKLTDE